nr:LysE family transporter [Jannaschia sp. Os4]
MLIVTPGPGVLSLAGVGGAFGMAAGRRYLVGLWLGTNVVLAMVLTGLAALVLADGRVRTVLLLASAAYLLWLAWRVATAATGPGAEDAARAPGIRDGIALQLVNPKGYAVNTTLMAGFPLGWAAGETLAKVVVLNLLWLGIHYLWLLFGDGLRRMEPSPGAQRWINRAMGASLAAVVALALAATLRA